MPKEFKFLKWSGKKAVAFLILTILLAVVAVGSTLAFVIVQTVSLKNEFVPPQIDVALENNEAKNTGDIAVYARAAVVATWVNGDGKTLAENPTVNVTPGSDWFVGADGFYYCKLMLAPGTASTPIASAELAADQTAPDGCQLRVQVFVSVIQATPAQAVESAWTAITVNGEGNLANKNN